MQGVAAALQVLGEDADGSELAELNFEENRVPVTVDQVPQDAINAVLATEDAEFYDHRGVNHLAIVRAALTNVQSGGIESGASTITTCPARGISS